MTTELDLAEQVRRLQEQMRNAESVIADLRNQPGMPVDGRQFSLKFPTLLIGPAGERYSIVRLAGGGLAVVAAAAAASDWSNA